jgi:hypothetical protein
MQLGGALLLLPRPCPPRLHLLHPGQGLGVADEQAKKLPHPLLNIYFFISTFYFDSVEKHLYPSHTVGRHRSLKFGSLCFSNRIP